MPKRYLKACQIGLDIETLVRFDPLPHNRDNRLACRFYDTHLHFTMDQKNAAVYSGALSKNTVGALIDVTGGTVGGLLMTLVGHPLVRTPLLLPCVLG